MARELLHRRPWCGRVGRRPWQPVRGDRRARGRDGISGVWGLSIPMPITITSAPSQPCRSGIDAPFYLHGADAPLLKRANLYRLLFEGREAVQIPAISHDIAGLPATFDIGPFAISWIATPGHTDGSVCLLIEDALFSGDTLMHNDVGRTDLPGGNHERLLVSVRKLMLLPGETVVYGGHGPEYDAGRGVCAGEPRLEVAAVIAIEQIACAFPSRCLSNEELKAAYPDWDFDRLERRTGVLSRYVAADGETALDFANRACRDPDCGGRRFGSMRSTPSFSALRVPITSCRRIRASCTASWDSNRRLWRSTSRWPVPATFTACNWAPV